MNWGWWGFILGEWGSLGNVLAEWGGGGGGVGIGRDFIWLGGGRWGYLRLGGCWW